MLAMLAFSEGTKGALAGGFEGSDGGGPIQAGAITERLHRREGDHARESLVVNALFPILSRDRDATGALFEIVKNQPGY